MSATKPINNIKNDYCIWGKNGNKTLHLRYSINESPKYYCNYDGGEFAVDINLYNSITEDTKVYDWREVMY
jgi:hypothetical protein